MSIFKLQQFSITQHKNAMKVCTDSLIFGAMIPIKGSPRVLDVGSGTGLLSLMAMQLGAQHVTALELIEDSAIEAKENFTQSQWSHNIDMHHCDFNAFDTNDSYDLIISNPPFFDNHLKNDDVIKSSARHTDTLNYHQLLSRCSQLLTANGLLYLLLPIHALKQIQAITDTLNLVMIERLELITLKGGKAKLTVLTYTLAAEKDNTAPLIARSLTIYDSHQQYSENSARLLNQFLLRFKQ